ncbi:hypothetical protein JKF63_01754 [Porcisia hertigi]|uniref:C2CD3 N-terminal C2 domain-containing protein n=1 Tax=Porcisia hertigi TaxID=2761500 RepID=A0A836HWS8_9TRYP|nr:hypothetical protein JKF63_01754 [Porcisia hertigi]
MRVVYGTPLPPGLVAPTRGELRLRIDRLILDDEVINHNPLVQLFEAPNSARATSSADVDGAETHMTPPLRSPNRFVVPIDYCCVGPIFWGETRPSAQGQPATPQLKRSPVTMAYPIKMPSTQFGAYLERMTASPQQGLQIDVFVPASYSGRPPVTVGRCRIALDSLQPGHPVKGWFPVVHRRPRLSVEDAGPYKFTEVPIGKLKLTATLEYYPSTRHPCAEPTAAAKHKRHKGKDGARVRLPQAMTHRSHRHPECTGNDAADPPTETSSTSTATAAAESPVSFSDSPPFNVKVGRLRRRHKRHMDHLDTSLHQDKTALTEQLLQQGLRLRAQMEAASRGLGIDEVGGLVAGDRREGDGLLSFEDAGTGMLAKNTDENMNDESEVAYTSEDSDEEKFALQMQKDAEARDRRGVHQHQLQQSTLSSSAPPGAAGVRHHLVSTPDATAACEAAIEAPPSMSGIGLRGTRATVELCFSNFSFAQTVLTADLHAMRINVRLSSDITTLEPSSGPLSSFVHPVPVEQPFICLHFDVCSYFEDHSKLVVEAYKVMGELELENQNDVWNVQGPRHVAKEELLGLSIIGLYHQSRAIVFRDPLADTSNVFAHLELRVRHHGRNHSPAASTVIDAPHPSQQQQHQHQLPRNPLQRATNSLFQRTSSDVSPPSNDPATTEAVRPVNQNAACTSSQKPPDEVRSAGEAPVKEETSSFTPGTYPLRISQAPAAKSPSIAVNERRRLRIVVYSAAELPRVAVAKDHHHGPPMGVNVGKYPIVSARPRSMPEAGVNGAVSYVEPNSFVTVEDVYRVSETSWMRSETAAPVVLDSSPSSSNRECIRDWYVDEALGGFYDRSAVAQQSSNPEYNYEVVLQLPEIPVATAGCTTATPITHSLADVLDELVLNVWHSDLPFHASALSGSAVTNGADGKEEGRSRKTNVPQEEEHFWAHAAYMGTCRVDLRALRYLKTLDGYYRVVCERNAGSAIDPALAEAQPKTIGHVRLSVALQ